MQNITSTESLQRLFGYSITGQTGEKIFPVFIGDAELIFKGVESVLGSGFFVQGDLSQKESLVRDPTKRLVLIRSDKMDGAWVKEALENDSIRFKLFMLSEDEPKITNIRAIADRLKIIRISTKSFGNVWKDETMKQELLNWLVRGSMKYYQDGLKFSDKIIKDTSDYIAKHS